MRIAIISDIHGNLVALQAALDDIARQNVDRTICLGDVAVMGPQPREVIGHLRDTGIPVVMGNTDQWLLNPEPWVDDGDESWPQVANELWAAAQLDEADRAAVAGYVPTLPLDFGDGFTLLCYHGSPRSFNDPVRPTTSEEELDGWFPDSRALVMAGGHTHEAMIRRYGTSLLINPGSIGLPVIMTVEGRAINPAWAEYALVDWNASMLSIALRRVPYSLTDLHSAALQSGLPHADYWLADWRDMKSSSPSEESVQEPSAVK